jgi:hypothetical protein
MTTVYVEGKSLRLRPADLLAQGGEAEVYDLHDGTVLKWFKPPQHPDFAGDAQVQAQVADRLAEHQHKLPAFPAGLPAQVVTPRALAFADRSGATIAGYRMTKVAGEPLHHLGEPRWRRDHAMSAADAVAPLLDLFDAVTALHQRGVVIGDFNDLNVLVDGPRAHLIDADSYQFGRFRCSMFSERFLDPRLCQGGQLMPAAPHDGDSDWFAFHVMVARTLLLVGPWGGVYQPADPKARCTPAARPLRRISIFAPEVTLPRAATPPGALPDELQAHLADVFHGKRSGPPPRRLLADLRFARCASCGLEHARRGCPACTKAAPRPAQATPSLVHGKLAAIPLDRAALLAALAAATAPVSASTARAANVWLESEALWRKTALGRERVGGILAGQTWAWTSATFGAGFYRAGGYTVGFVFDPRRGVLDDRLRLPPLLGELVSAHATLSSDRAWLWITLARAGRLTTTAIVFDRSGAVLAALRDLDPPSDPSLAWLAGTPGACATGPYLFVPTDAGILRVETDAGRLTVTRTFAETAPFVCAADRLALGPGAIDVLRREDAIRLSLS